MLGYEQMTVSVLRELCRARGISECSSTAYIRKNDLIELLKKNEASDTDYERMKFTDLEKLCIQRGINECITPGRRRNLRKGDLIDLLQKYDESGESSRLKMTTVSRRSRTAVIPYGNYDVFTVKILKDLCKVRNLPECNGRYVSKQRLINLLKEADQTQGELNYSALTVDVLQDICRRRNIPGCGRRKNISKYELIKKIREADDTTPYFKRRDSGSPMASVISSPRSPLSYSSTGLSVVEPSEVTIVAV